MRKTVRLGITSLIAAVLLGLPAGGALAHKGKLPEDALTLVRQASALLAQNPGMTGEVRERVQAALRSRKPAGVHLDQVAAALKALDQNDIATARRLLMASIMPAGMPMPPEGPGGIATKTAASPSAVTPRPLPPAVPAPSPPPIEQAMKMAEPLRARFTGSATEVSLLVLGLGLIGVGLILLGRGREVVRP
jgi:hypothetical protein